MKPVVFHPSAVRELSKASRYYQRQKRRLGEELEAETRATVKRLQENPELGSSYEETGKRFYLVKRFPYAVIYKEFADCIGIYAVAHTSRRPGYWKRRKLP